MPERVKFPREAWLPLLAGLAWLWLADGAGLVFTLFAAVPGCLLLGSGVSMLLWPGDLRMTHYAAIGGLIGGLVALPGVFAVGFGAAFVLMALSAAGSIAAGSHALNLEPPTEGVPVPTRSLGLSAQVAADEALLATMTLTMAFPGRSEMGRIEAEVTEARALFDGHGWYEKPVDYHVAPPPLEAPMFRSARLYGTSFERLSFDSGYAPHPDEPGRDRWLGYANNRTGHAWVVRHGDADRPWLVCVHGYQMGIAGIDMLAFPPALLHERLGMNLLYPVLPLHGERKMGRRSGDGFLTGDILDSIHAEAQAMWDIRRLLGWVRSQSEAPIGVLGYSLGGYQTALLASLDDGLACAIAGIPLTDIPRVTFRHGPALELRHALDRGLDIERMDDVMRVVSPLALTPQVPKDRRYLFAASADRLVPPDQVRDLWRHWDEPRIEWYPGAHITFRAHAGVQRLIAEGLRESGLTT